MSTQREDLERLRAVLWDALEKAQPAVKAQVAGQLRTVIKDLAGLGSGTEETLDDVLAQRRKAREQGAKPSARSQRGRKQPGG